MIALSCFGHLCEEVDIVQSPESLNELHSSSNFVVYSELSAEAGKFSTGLKCFCLLCLFVCVCVWGGGGGSGVYPSIKVHSFTGADSKILKREGQYPQFLKREKGRRKIYTSTDVLLCFPYKVFLKLPTK